jgi:outer membrane protein, heavy metal efflux system
MRILCRTAAIAALVPSVFLQGCRSLDTTADYEQAMSLVEARSGWRPTWNAPWSEAVPPWDGLSPLTVDQAVTIALQNNRQMRATLEAIATARADLVQSGLLPNPVLSVAFGSPVKGASGTTSYSVSLIQQLTDLWKRPARRDAAAATLQQQILSVSDAALRLVADVRTGHAEIVYAQHGITLTESHIEIVKRSVDVTRRRIQAGEATELDANRLLQLQLSLQSELSLQNLDLDTLKRELLSSIGRAELPAAWTADSSDTLPASKATQLTEDQLIDLVQVQRLDVAAAKQELDSIRHELRVAKLGAIPDLGAGPSYSRDEDKRDELGAALDLEIPIFDTNRASYARAKSQLRRAQARYELAAQTAIVEARNAWLQTRTAQELVVFFQENVLLLAEDNLSLAEQAFQAGQVDMTVVLETRRQHIEAEIQLNEFKALAEESVIELEYAVGGRLVSPVDQLPGNDDADNDKGGNP